MKEEIKMSVVFGSLMFAIIIGILGIISFVEYQRIQEKCKNYEDFLEIDDYIEHLKNKIDELIDEINNLKEK